MNKPESILRNVDGINLIYPDEFMSEIMKIPVERRLIGSLALAGCESWDEEGRYIKNAAVSIAAINGATFDTQTLSVNSVADKIKMTVEQSRSMMELSSAFSYLNSGNLEKNQLYDKVVELGHFSVAHTVTSNLIVAGASTAVENEFNSQRDIVHLSRVTIGRTALQSYPPILVRNGEHINAAQAITEAIDGQVAKLELNMSASREDKLNYYEARNTLYPATKASAFMLSGSLRNIQKLVAQQEDPGKEEEFRIILKQINTQLNGIWPEIFNR